MPSQNPTPSQTSLAIGSVPLQPPTVLEHIQEFRTRLFWVVGSIVLTSSAGYFIKDQMLSWLTRPLGDQQLYYLTPIGGLSFIIKLCFYFGILASVPIIVFHIYKYLQPLMPGERRSVKWYFIFSVLLAVGGVCFAYFISLPSALHFLTDFNISHITAMLTVDAYLTFVTSYLLGAALLFQIPLLLLVIDKITPLTPRGLMQYQRHVILVAFILAAIISPTPDIINQALLAVPIIAMYQFGICLVWQQHARRRRQEARVKLSEGAQQPSPPALQKRQVVSVVPEPILQPAIAPRQRQRSVQNSLISDFGPVRPQKRPLSKTVVNPKPITRPAAPLARSLIPERKIRIERSRRFASIDGIIAR